MLRLSILFLFCSHFLFGQTGVGVGIYPTGTESGFGMRLSKEQRLTLDARVAKGNFYSELNKTSSFVSEVSGIFRVVKLEKVRFHVGLGIKSEWNLHDEAKHGLTIPIGVEAFPFPFQNAGLFFEAAPFYIADSKSNYAAGLRTAAGFVFYFLKKSSND